MKQYFTGFFTGVCLVVSAVMFMGAGEPNSKIGKYQGFGTAPSSYLIDTETGQLWVRRFVTLKYSSWEAGWYPIESAFLEE